MPISPKDAAEALSDIARVEQRSLNMRGYEYGAPHFFLWGVIWVLGYGLSDFLPTRAGIVWLVLSVGGQIGSFLIARSAAAGAPRTAGPGLGVGFVAWAVTIVAFIGATYYVMGAHSAVQFGAFPALVMATAYTLFGIWRGTRWSVAGVALGVCTVTGFTVFREHFMLWMAAAGGATLLLSGFWLRRA